MDCGNRGFERDDPVGLGLGIAAAFAIDYLDDTVKTPEDVAAAQAPGVGAMPCLMKSITELSARVVTSPTSPLPSPL